MKNRIGVAIVGGSGYGAGELLRYLSWHPECSVVSVVSSSQGGEPIAKAHSHLAGFYSDLKFDSALNWESLRKHARRVVFLALPHGHSAKAVKEIEADGGSGTRIIDLAADFRLTDDATHARTYPDVEFEGALRKKFVYGLPEFNREQISSAHYITNPGCLATASALAAAPLLAKWGQNVIGSICFDAKTGTSGAGRSAQDSMHHPLRHGNFEAYKILAHRHEPEIRQALGKMAQTLPPSMFVPHLLPTARGIFVTLYAQLQGAVEQKTLVAAYRTWFEKNSFIRMREGSPNLNDVVGTNFCDVSVVARGNQVVVMATLDNLGKGMAGQAIQNLNLVFGLPENLGLLQPALGVA